MSVLDTILDAVVTDHTTAALSVASNTLSAVKRKLPKKEEKVDLAYRVTVSGAEDVDSVERIAFGSVFRVTYKIEMTLITPNDRDALTNLPEHAAWREATRARYMKATTTGPLSGVSQAKRIEIVKGPFLDRRKMAQGYDYNQICLAVTTYEKR